MRNRKYKSALVAANRMDWRQVVLNGGPPCFHIEEGGSFCGRAQRWEGHGLEDFHEFVSLESLLTDVRANPKTKGMRNETA